MSNRLQQPPAVRDMEAIVRVTETAERLGHAALHLKGVPQPDGTVARVFATFERDVLYIERDGHPTRTVRVADLATAILEATE